MTTDVISGRHGPGASAARSLDVHLLHGRVETYLNGFRRHDLQAAIRTALANLGPGAAERSKCQNGLDLAAQLLATSVALRNMAQEVRARALRGSDIIPMVEGHLEDDGLHPSEALIRHHP